MLLHIPDILDQAQVRAIRQALDEATWTDGRETVGPQGAKVKRNLQLPDASPLRAELGRVVLDALARNPLYHAATLPLRTLAPRFNRYEGGGQYGFHIDGAVMSLPNGEQLRSDISCTLFLAEPDEYDGGELIIEDTYGVQQVKLAAGDMIVYPATSLHQVAPVTRGVRLASFFWAQSLVRSDTQRALLFDMDTAIQRLNSTQADDAARRSLVGCYHNLLRLWSET
jgi:PKHD-type hydroxylase